MFRNGINDEEEDLPQGPAPQMPPAPQALPRLNNFRINHRAQPSHFTGTEVPHIQHGLRRNRNGDLVSPPVRLGRFENQRKRLLSSLGYWK